jgi:hypothetical protein
MPLASASSSVNRMPSPTIVSRFGVLPDIMPIASTDLNGVMCKNQRAVPSFTGNPGYT